MSIQIALSILIRYYIRIELQLRNQVNILEKVHLRILSKKAVLLLNQRLLIKSINLKYLLKENPKDSLTQWFYLEQALQLNSMI